MPYPLCSMSESPLFQLPSETLVEVLFHVTDRAFPLPTRIVFDMKQPLKDTGLLDPVLRYRFRPDRYKAAAHYYQWYRAQVRALFRLRCVSKGMAVLIDGTCWWRVLPLILAVHRAVERPTHPVASLVVAPGDVAATKAAVMALLWPTPDAKSRDEWKRRAVHDTGLVAWRPLHCVAGQWSDSMWLPGPPVYAPPETTGFPDDVLAPPYVVRPVDGPIEMMRLGDTYYQPAGSPLIPFIEAARPIPVPLLRGLQRRHDDLHAMAVAIWDALVPPPAPKKTKTERECDEATDRLKRARFD